MKLDIYQVDAFSQHPFGGNPAAVCPLAEWLPDEAAVAEYLTVVMEENDPAALAKALGTIARARGMSEVAAKAGIGREALYKALRDGASPRYETISRVFQALRVKLVQVPQGT